MSNLADELVQVLVLYTVQEDNVTGGSTEVRLVSLVGERHLTVASVACCLFIVDKKQFQIPVRASQAIADFTSHAQTVFGGRATLLSLQVLSPPPSRSVPFEAVTCSEMLRWQRVCGRDDDLPSFVFTIVLTKKRARNVDVAEKPATGPAASESGGQGSKRARSSGLKEPHVADDDFENEESSEEAEDDGNTSADSPSEAELVIDVNTVDKLTLRLSTSLAYATVLGLKQRKLKPETCAARIVDCDTTGRIRAACGMCPKQFVGLDFNLLLGWVRKHISTQHVPVSAPPPTPPTEQQLGFRAYFMRGQSSTSSSTASALTGAMSVSSTTTNETRAIVTAPQSRPHSDLPARPVAPQPCLGVAMAQLTLGKGGERLSSVLRDGLVDDKPLASHSFNRKDGTALFSYKVHSAALCDWDGSIYDSAALYHADCCHEVPVNELGRRKRSTCTACNLLLTYKNPKNKDAGLLQYVRAAVVTLVKDRNEGTLKTMQAAKHSAKARQSARRLALATALRAVMTEQLFANEHVRLELLQRLLKMCTANASKAAKGRRYPPHIQQLASHLLDLMGRRAGMTAVKTFVGDMAESTIARYRQTLGRQQVPFHNN